MSVPQHKQGCCAAAVKKRDGWLLKLPLRGRHWAEACQYVLCIEYKWSLEGKYISPFFLNFSTTYAVAIFSHIRASNL